VWFSVGVVNSGGTITITHTDGDCNVTVSTNLVGGYASYTWQLSGETGTGATVTRSFDTPGTYTCTFTATAKNGPCDTITRSIPLTVTVNPSCEDDGDCPACMYCDMPPGADCSMCLPDCTPTNSTNCVSAGYFTGGSASASPSVVCVSNAITFNASATLTPGIIRVINKDKCCNLTTNTGPDGTGVGYTWSLTGGVSGSGSSLTTNLPPGTYVWTCTASVTNAVCAVASTNLVATGTVHKTTITVDDQPNRPSTMWPWTWEATLQAVCVSGTNNTSTSFSTSYTSLASITYGFTVNGSGTVTSMSKSGDGNPGAVNTIVVTTFAANNGTPGVANAGITIAAYYAGCCDNGQMNWVQTLTTDTQPLAGETIPFPDCFTGPPTQCPYYFGWSPGASGWRSWDFISSHTTTTP
jgi:hypothetical protein